MTIANRVLAALLALALLLGGLLAAAEIVLAQIGRPPWLVAHQQWGAWLREQTLTDWPVRAALAGLVLVGLLLLVPALRRGRPAVLDLPAAVDGVHVTASRRGIERTVRDAARRTPGVRSATVRAGRRTVKVTAHTAARTPGQLREQVTGAVTGRLDQLGLSSTVRPKVRLVTGERR